MENFKTLKIERQDGVVLLAINRPDKLNALNGEVLSELKEFLGEVKEQTSFEVRGIILTGTGDKAFIAGADIAAMDAMSTEEGIRFGELGQTVSRLFEEISVPVIAAVNGFALGGGCEMAMSCDFIYATKKAIFGQPEVKLGLIPGFGGTQRLMRLVGVPLARELIYTGRNLSAEEALSAGLVQKLFTDPEELLSGARQTMDEILSKSSVIIGICKDVIRRGENLEIREGLMIENQGFGKAFSTEDKQEGTRAFVEKRKAHFKNR